MPTGVFEAPVNVQGVRDLFTGTVMEKWFSLNERWYKWFFIDAAYVPIHGSQATLTTPTTRTIGGYRLNASTEYVYPSIYLQDDFAGGDVQFFTFFETNDSNVDSGQDESVRLVAHFFMKSLHRNTDNNRAIITMTRGPINHDIKVANARINETFIGWHTVNTNEDQALRSNMIVKARINLCTTVSDVADIVVNYFVVGYPTNSVHAVNPVRPITSDTR